MDEDHDIIKNVQMFTLWGLKLLDVFQQHWTDTFQYLLQPEEFRAAQEISALHFQEDFKCRLRDKS